MRLRIGELARRTGVSPALLRAWEQRYGVIAPERSPGGTRLYGAEDERRIRAMQAHMAVGLSTAEAARATVAGEPVGAPPADSPAVPAPGWPTVAVPASGWPTVAAPAPGWPTVSAPAPGWPTVSAPAPGSAVDAGGRALREALGRLDREATERALDFLLGTLTFETVAERVLLPYLAEVGGRWAQGEAAIAEEHLATHILRARLLALTHGLAAGSVRARAVLACPPGEQHDIALAIFAVALERRGWRVTLLGANTPVGTMRDAADLLSADCVVVSAVRRERITAVAGELAQLAAGRAVWLAGPGATERAARRVGASRLAGDPVHGAVLLDERIGGPAEKPLAAAAPAS